MPSHTAKERRKQILKRSFGEVFRNTPKAVERTARKKGRAAAEKQRVAIALSKARRAGARIPRK